MLNWPQTTENSYQTPLTQFGLKTKENFLINANSKIGCITNAAGRLICRYIRTGSLRRRRLAQYARWYHNGRHAGRVLENGSGHRTRNYEWNELWMLERNGWTGDSPPTAASSVAGATKTNAFPIVYLFDDEFCHHHRHLTSPIDQHTHERAYRSAQHDKQRNQANKRRSIKTINCFPSRTVYQHFFEYLLRMFDNCLRNQPSRYNDQRTQNTNETKLCVLFLLPSLSSFAPSADIIITIIVVIVIHSFIHSVRHSVIHIHSSDRSFIWIPLRCVALH